MTSDADRRAALRRTWAPGLLIFVAATALAALCSPSVSIWTDEAVTISAAERTPAQLWDLLQRIDAVHALYYFFMSGWIDLAGASPFALRLPSAVAAGVTALGVYVLARSLTTHGTAVAAGVIAALLPRLTWGGIEARPFIFSALAAVWLSVGLIRACRRPSPSRWMVYAVLAVAGVTINIYLVLLVAAHAVTVLIRYRRRRVVVGFAIGAAATALLTSPLLLLVRSQQAQLGGSGDRGPLSIARKIFVNQFFLGETPDAASAPGWFTRAWQVAAIAACALGLAAMLCAVLRRPRPGDDRAGMLALTIPWIALPTGVVAVYSVAIAPIYQPRYFTFTAPAAALLIALGIRTLGRRWYVVTGVVLYVAAVSIVYSSQRIPYAKSGSDWSTVASTILAASETGDSVYFAPRYDVTAGEPITLTTRRIEQSYPQSFRSLDDLTKLATGAETATLDGFSRPLREVEGLDTKTSVWAIFARAAPATVRTDADEVFTDAGFRGNTVFQGPSTVVIHYTR